MTDDQERIMQLELQLEQLQRAREQDYHVAGKSMFQMVRDFHEKFELEIAEKPVDFTYESEEDHDDLFRLRNRLHKEEWEEFEKAWGEEDLVAFTDACADLIYVILGTMVSCGIPFDECFAEVQRSNMSKLGVDDRPVKREDGKILKGPYYSPPDLRPIIYGH